MPPKAQRARLQVIKIPLDYYPVVHPPNFPPMPRLYLELLENKKKVRPELRNKEYVPKDISHMQGPPLEEVETTTNMSETLRMDEEKSSSSSSSLIDKVKEISTAKKPRTVKKPPLQIIDLTSKSAADIAKMAEERSSAKTQSKKELHEFDDAPKDKSDTLTGGFPKPGPQLDSQYRKIRLAGSPSIKDMAERSGRDRHRDERKHTKDRQEDQEDRHRHNEQNDKDEQDERSDRDDRRRDRYDRGGRDERRRDERSPEKREERDDRRGDRSPEKRDDRREDSSSSSRRGDDLSSMIAPSASASISLEDLLQGKDPEARKTGSPPKDGRSPATSGPVGQPGVPKIAPSLGEIQSGRGPVTDEKGIRDINYVTKDEENEVGKKRDILFKFKSLRKLYKEAIIPEFTEYTDIKTLEREYESVVRQLSLDATVENYRKYLTIGFFVLEVVMTNFFKFEEIRGFTQQQLLGMNQYERILFQIGEKSYFSGKKSWPPEVQLIGMILLNGAVFVGSKMLFKATGSNILAMLNPQPTSSGPPHASQPVGHKPKMRGPEINIDQLSGKKNT